MRKGSNRISISPDASEKPMMFPTFNPSGSASRSQRQAHRGFSSRILRNARFPAVKFFRRMGANVAKAVRLIPRRKANSATDATSNMTHQKFAPPRDSHQSEAIEDCIKFINSSSRKY